MGDRSRRGALGVAVLMILTLCALPASAQLNDQLSAYTGANAKGYLQPIADAFGAALNDGYYHSARIPRMGLQISLELPVMGVIFGDGDRTFSAVTEGGFSPQTTASDAPTVVGSGDAKVVSGDGGTQYAFPGGFNLNSFGIVVPQLRVGGIMGTEAVVRWIAFNPDSDAELGDITLWGFGLRHSVSQYISGLPLEVAAGFMWQSFKVGTNDSGSDLISADAFSFGVQASKPIGLGFIGVEPFGGLSLDTFSMKVNYHSDVTDDELDVDFGTDTTVHLTVGAGLSLPIAHAYGAFNFASQSSFDFGIALGNVGF